MSINARVVTDEERQMLAKLYPRRRVTEPRCEHLLQTVAHGLRHWRCSRGVGHSGLHTCSSSWSDPLPNVVSVAEDRGDWP